MNSGDNIVGKEEILGIDDIRRSIEIIINGVFERMFDNKENGIGQKKL